MSSSDAAFDERDLSSLRVMISTGEPWTPEAWQWTFERVGRAAGLGGAFRPAEVVFVPDLPRTRTMKVMRRVVRAAWLGEEPGDLSTLSNPESVQAIRDARQ